MLNEYDTVFSRHKAKFHRHEYVGWFVFEAIVMIHYV